MNLTEPTWLGLATFLVVIAVTAAASAFLAALIVEDDVTEPLREWVWGPEDRPRFPHKGRGLPIELDGGLSAMRPGTYLGDLIMCVRCTGVYTTAAVLAAWWSIAGVPGSTTGEKIVLGAIQFAATCQTQRRLNAGTARRSPLR